LRPATVLETLNVVESTMRASPPFAFLRCFVRRAEMKIRKATGPGFQPLFFDLRRVGRELALGK